MKFQDRYHSLLKNGLILRIAAMENWCLCPTKYLVDNHKLSRALFYEALLRKFGNMDAIQLSEPPDLKAMAMKAGLLDA